MALRGVNPLVFHMKASPIQAHHFRNVRPGDVNVEDTNGVTLLSQGKRKAGGYRGLAHPTLSGEHHDFVLDFTTDFLHRHLAFHLCKCLLHLLLFLRRWAFKTLVTATGWVDGYGGIRHDCTTELAYFNPPTKPRWKN